jgi:hypothetical protein
MIGVDQSNGQSGISGRRHFKSLATRVKAIIPHLPSFIPSQMDNSQKLHGKILATVLLLMVSRRVSQPSQRFLR